MCGHKGNHQQAPPQPARYHSGGADTQPLGPLPGANDAGAATRRFDATQPDQFVAASVEQAPQSGTTQRSGWAAFPWWTLWLLWPLSGLFKWLGPSLHAATSDAGLYFQDFFWHLQYYWPLLIVAAFIFMHRRRRHYDR